MNVPSPIAKRIDWIDSERVRGLGGSCRRAPRGPRRGLSVSVPSIAPMVAERTSVCRVSFLRPSDQPAVAIRQLARWAQGRQPGPLLIETSGSTGRPKGVVLSRAVR